MLPVSSQSIRGQSKRTFFAILCHCCTSLFTVFLNWYLFLQCQMQYKINSHCHKVVKCDLHSNLVSVNFKTLAFSIKVRSNQLTDLKKVSFSSKLSHFELIKFTSSLAFFIHWMSNPFQTWKKSSLSLSRRFTEYVWLLYCSKFRIKNSVQMERLVMLPIWFLPEPMHPACLRFSTSCQRTLMWILFSEVSWANVSQTVRSQDVIDPFMTTRVTLLWHTLSIQLKTERVFPFQILKESGYLLGGIQGANTFRLHYQS